MRILIRREYVKKFYDQIGHKIYQPFIKLIGYQAALPSAMKEILYKVELKDGYCILDVGIGPGRAALSLLKELNVNVVGIDISKAHLKVAKRNLEGENLKNGIELITADANNLPFKEDYFDFVVSTGMIEHLGTSQLLDHTKSVVKEMFRVLRYDRKMLLVTTRNSIFGRFLAFMWQAGYYSEDEVSNVMKSSGLESIEPLSLDVKAIRIPKDTGIVMMGSKVDFKIKS